MRRRGLKIGLHIYYLLIIYNRNESRETMFNTYSFYLISHKN